MSKVQLQWEKHKIFNLKRMITLNIDDPVEIGLKFKTACQDRQAKENAVKCFLEGHNRKARVGFKPRPCGSQSWRSNHSTRLPTSYHGKFKLQATWVVVLKPYITC